MSGTLSSCRPGDRRAGNARCRIEQRRHAPNGDAATAGVEEAVAGTPAAPVSAVGPRRRRDTPPHLVPTGRCTAAADLHAMRRPAGRDLLRSLARPGSEAESERHATSHRLVLTDDQRTRSSGGLGSRARARLRLFGRFAAKCSLEVQACHDPLRIPERSAVRRCGRAGWLRRPLPRRLCRFAQAAPHAAGPAPGPASRTRRCRRRTRTGRVPSWSRARRRVGAASWRSQQGSPVGRYHRRPKLDAHRSGARPVRVSISPPTDSADRTRLDVS